MRIAEINMVSNGSTGNIMLNIAKLLNVSGNEARTFSAKYYSVKRMNFSMTSQGHSYFGNRVENFFHTAGAQLTGLNGFFSHVGTHGLIRELKKFKPDVIHLHNLHKFCINLPMLMRYIKKNNIPVVWTLHDCWTFTGHCPHFVIAGCDKWKTECHHCHQLSIYPKSRVDNTRMAHRLKKKWFSGINNMTLATPSEWLANLTRESFLSQYPVKVINNGIDLSVFKPTESNFREKHGLQGKKIVLGVSSVWNYGKGLDVIIEIAKRLDDTYKVVLVGASDAVDAQLPKNVLSIHRTENQTQLAEIYTVADLFVNATREDTYPTVNMEALACGTPVLTFKTGGSPEIIDSSCGSVVEVNDVDAMEKEIVRICCEKPYSREACLKKATSFDMNDRFEEYIKLYSEVITK